MLLPFQGASSQIWQYTPRVSLRLPWAMWLLGFQPAVDHQRDNSTRHWIIDSQLNLPSTIRETTQLAVGCQLNSKYHLMDDEISFVEKMIKPME